MCSCNVFTIHAQQGPKFHIIEMSEQGQAVYWYLFTKQLLTIHLWLHEYDPDRQNSINYIT